MRGMRQLLVCVPGQTAIGTVDQDDAKDAAGQKKEIKETGESLKMADENKKITEKTEAVKDEKNTKADKAVTLRSVSATPHIRDHSSTHKIMTWVIVALMPATLDGIRVFGPKALAIILISIVSCIVFEGGFEKITKQKVTIGDRSAVLTGLLLALNLPVSVPLWMPVLGGFFAIVVVKMLFGGLGKNFMNPALGARCFLMLSFSKLMTDFSYRPGGNGADVVSGPTALASLKNGEAYDLKQMFLGYEAGTIGETSALSLLLGGCFLIAIGVIGWEVTYTYILSLLVFVAIFSGHGLDINYLSAHVYGGGLMLGAFFMATDYVTRPITKKGQILYGIFLGVLTGIFRLYGPGAEGVSYAIIIGNLIVPLIERVTLPKHFGYQKPAKAAKN